MSQTQWDPFESISSLRREINRLMEDFLEGRAFRGKSGGTHPFRRGLRDLRGSGGEAPSSWSTPRRS